MPNQVKAPFQLFVKESSIWFYTAQHKSVNLLGILLQISFVFILQCIYIEVCLHDIQTHVCLLIDNAVVNLLRIFRCQMEF
jgi:hypothetical protein